MYGVHPAGEGEETRSCFDWAEHERVSLRPTDFFRMMRQKLGYIHANPVKRGYLNLPQHWRYSSAANYEGLAGLMEMDVW